METIEQRIQSINEWFNNAVKEINERREYRMKNYYDCVDDYSYGGLCDKADDELEDKLRTQRDILIEQAKNDGKVIRQSSFYRLVSATGSCEGASYGEYGEYFAIDGKFVGVPKRLSTLTKKGYKLVHVERTYECVFREMGKYGVLWKSMVLLDEKISQCDAVPDYIGNKPSIDFQYDLYFNKDLE